jgi:hypothetical protein
MALMPLANAGNHWALDEFREIERVLERQPDNYFFGTNMFILGRKK